ncbi:MAG: hypothetical protein HC844_10530 [Tabrizicola sp.]|nr:hypothetical protein [Tabrizicola sp.]
MLHSGIDDRDRSWRGSCRGASRRRSGDDARPRPATATLGRAARAVACRSGCAARSSPVAVPAGAIEGLERDMMVSPQHRLLMADARAEILFGETEVLVAATHLVGHSGVVRALPETGVTYIHILFDRHEIVQSDGIWTESFQPAERMLTSMEASTRQEILDLFPELDRDGARYPAARTSLKAHEVRVLLAA